MARITEIFAIVGSHTWSVPRWLLPPVSVRCIGGGGGGGSGIEGSKGGSGGGGGEVVESEVYVSPGSDIAIVVGAGGAGGAGRGVPGTDGANGASTTFDATVVVASGGRGGKKDGGAVGSGGTGGTGDDTEDGGAGCAGSAAQLAGGGGGSSGGTVPEPGVAAVDASGATAPAGGGDGGDGWITVNTDGASGSSPGGGGGGGGADGGGVGEDTLGGAGAAGKCEISYTVADSTRRCDHVHTSPVGSVWTGVGRYDGHWHSESPVGPIASVLESSIAYDGSADTRYHEHNLTPFGPLIASTQTRSQSRGLVELGDYAVHLRVDVDRDGLGTWQSLCDLYDIDWVMSASIKESIDSPVASASVVLQRTCGALTVSPHVRSSLLNQVSGVYTRLLDLGRGIRVYAAIAPCGAGAASADYVLRFSGRIDSIEVGDDDVRVAARDMGGVLQDTFIEGSATYGNDDVEAEMQEIINASMSSPVTLYTPASPGWVLLPWMQDRMPLLDALRRLALQIGWDVRYKYDSGTSAYRLTLWSPDRANEVPAEFIQKDRYYSTAGASLSLSGIRNVGDVSYTDSVAMTRSIVNISDAASIAKYGRRFFAIAESSTSNIDTSTEATAMITAAIADLSEPVVEQSIESKYNPLIELSDTVLFARDGVMFDADQRLAVTSLSHSFGDGGSATTTLGLRGKAAVGFSRWLSLDSRLGTSPIRVCTLSKADSTQSFGAPAVDNVVIFDNVAVEDDASMWTYNDPSYELYVWDTGIYEVIGSIFLSTDGIASGGLPVVVDLAAPGRVYSYKKLGPVAATDVFEVPIAWRGTLLGGTQIKVKVTSVASNVALVIGSSYPNRLSVRRAR